MLEGRGSVSATRPIKYTNVPEQLRRKKENPLWAEILDHSYLKVVQWSKRVLSKWNHKVHEVVKAGRQPQLRSNAVCAVYRDAGREKEVWRMSCLMTHYDRFFQENLSAAQYQALMVQWSSGRLDARLTPEVMAMRPDFRPQDLAFVFMEVEDVPKNFLEDNVCKEKGAVLEKLVRKLRAEQGMFRREHALRKAAEGNYLGLHATWQEKVEEAVDQLWEDHKANYQIFLSPDLPSGHRCLVSARADLVGLDVLSLSRADQVPSIGFWNLPMLGSGASTHVDSVVTTIAADCAHSPQHTVHVVCPPNQPSFGKTTDPDVDVRGQDVADHVERWWAALTEPSRELAVVKASLLSAAPRCWPPKNP